MNDTRPRCWSLTSPDMPTVIYMLTLSYLCLSWSLKATFVFNIVDDYKLLGNQ